MMILAVDDTENLLSNGPTLAASSLDSSSSPWSELKGFRAGDQQRKVYAHVRVLNVGNIRVGDQSFDTRFDFECCWEVFVRSELERAKEVQEANMDGNPGKALTWDPGLAFPSAISYEAVGIRTILVHDAISSRSCEENRSSDSIYCGSRSGSSAVAVGRVGFRVKIGGTFKCSQDLRDFPFDKQASQLRFVLLARVSSCVWMVSYIIPSRVSRLLTSGTASCDSDGAGSTIRPAAYNFRGLLRSKSFASEYNPCTSGRGVRLSARAFPPECDGATRRQRQAPESCIPIHVHDSN
mmetsp:Transcript_48878/g.96711  ORF Transcript_48878/g.96711 Transcript_48878/m.96711 type:complete len:295 (-) Transcript_48878:706-1590(-)